MKTNLFCRISLAVVLAFATTVSFAQNRTEVPSTQLRIPITEPTILVAVPTANGVVFRPLVVSGGLSFTNVSGSYVLNFTPPVVPPDATTSRVDTFLTSDAGVVNQTLELSGTPIENRGVSCFVNGLAMTRDIDYTRTGKTVTFTGTVLLNLYSVRCDYFVVPVGG